MTYKGKHVQFGKHVYVNMRENSNKLVRMVPLLICCVKKTFIA
jgi:uncharacterized membrane protein YcgQ (UPF0703/DUF1980 family)